jgi:hypothetical protein
MALSRGNPTPPRSPGMVNNLRRYEWDRALTGERDQESLARVIPAADG